MFIAGLPPNDTVCTLGVPSANVEFTRTLPLGRPRNGSLHADRRLAEDAEAEVAGVPSLNSAVPVGAFAAVGWQLGRH
jgi:hypothetical protein